jgi:hypothetical protein
MVEIRFNPAAIGTVPDGSITEAKLANDAVTNAKIADNAVDTLQIKNNAIIATKILDGEVKELKVEVKKFVKADALTGDKKVLAMGYDTATGEIIIDRDEDIPSP